LIKDISLQELLLSWSFPGLVSWMHHLVIATTCLKICIQIFPIVDMLYILI